MFVRFSFARHYLASASLSQRQGRIHVCIQNTSCLLWQQEQIDSANSRTGQAAAQLSHDLRKT